MRGGIGRHLLEPRPRPPLPLAASLRGSAGPVQALDQLVADPFQLGHVGDVTLWAKQGMGRLAWLAGVARVGGELRLQAGDLAPELLPPGPLVGGHLGYLRRLWNEPFAGLAGGRAGRVDRPRQVARIDAMLVGALDRLRSQALEVRRAWGVLGHEGPQAMA